MTPQPIAFPRHRFPTEIISHAVWLYHVFRLSLRDVELILVERDVTDPGEHSPLVHKVRQRLRLAAEAAPAVALRYAAVSTDYAIRTY
jgi:transposase-like protein